MSDKKHRRKTLLWRCILALIMAMAVDHVAGQVSTPSPPGATLAPIDDFQSIYSNGDLILVNPQQSTVIFLCVILFSTALEWVIEWMGAHPNKYIRIIFYAIKEEVTCISFTEMLLLFVAFSFDLAKRWRIVIQWVVMCLLFLAFGFGTMITVVATILRIQARRWRTFEWAKIEADAHHDTHEQIFKLSRNYFLHKISQRICEDGVRTAEIPLVAFSAYIGRVERRVLPVVFDFTLKTWAGLGLVIVVNGARSIVAASISPDAHLVQILTFIFVIGYGILGGYFALHIQLTRRLRQFMLTHAVQVESGEDPSTSSRSQSTARVAKNTQQCLFFRTASATFELIKVIMLAMLWYVAVLIMAYTYVTYDEVGWYSLLLYILAVVPPIIVTLKLPWTLNVATICVALGDDFEDKTPEDLLKFLSSIEESESDEEDKDDVDDMPTQQTATPLAPAAVATGHDVVPVDDLEETHDAEDEWSGQEVSLHQSLGAENAPSGEPQRLLGVPPTQSIQKKFSKRLSRPVFQGAL